MKFQTGKSKLFVHSAQRKVNCNEVEFNFYYSESACIAEFHSCSIHILTVIYSPTRSQLVLMTFQSSLERLQFAQLIRGPFMDDNVKSGPVENIGLVKRTLG